MQSLLKTLFRARLVSINVGPYLFSPGLIMSILTVATVYFMVSMGLWQVERAEYKDNLLNKIVSRKDLPPVSFQQIPASEDERVFLPVRVYGEYDTERHFLLDNRIVNAQVGYDLYTPLKMPDGRAILVNRGFIPMGKTRQDLPAIETRPGLLNVEGLLQNTPPKTIVLADEVNQVVTWPVVLQYIDLQEIETILGYPVFNMVMWTDSEENTAFDRARSSLNLDSTKNMGYVFQWYAFAVTLIIIYLIVNTKKRNA